MYDEASDVCRERLRKRNTVTATTSNVQTTPRTMPAIRPMASVSLLAVDEAACNSVDVVVVVLVVVVVVAEEVVVVLVVPVVVAVVAAAVVVVVVVTVVVVVVVVIVVVVVVIMARNQMGKPTTTSLDFLEHKQ